ncbi:alcohol dehydrogenase catalytic domain-containing protein [Streptomyces noboritoensis]|uniref:alcohol dehydrogenase n=1 Tax=Streptomyces noboritoensis TaxID=67337 RepID=A0ABV6T9H4_9ACTN
MPLRLAEVADPEPRPGWVVVDIEAAGICGSDVHIVRGKGDDWTVTVPVPLTLGHEGAGVISALGDGVEGFAVGDRVGVATIAHPMSVPYGVGVDGAFAEQMLADARTLLPIPENVPFAQAAVATDAVATAYRAVRTVGRASLDDVVAVIGLGGLGLNGVRVATLCGATVYGVDVNPHTFGAAWAAGAKDCFLDPDALLPVEPDLVVDFAGMGDTVGAAVRVVRPGGRVVLVGLGRDTSTFNTAELVMKYVDLRGSIGASKEEIERVYALLSQGAIRPELSETPFTELNDAIQALALGKVTGRLFTRPRA